MGVAMTCRWLRNVYTETDLYSSVGQLKGDVASRRSTSAQNFGLSSSL